MKKFFRYLMIALIIAVVLVMTVTHNKSIADVGSFEDYDSGSSWDDDYDSGSSWDDDWDSGSSWDDDYDSSSSWDSDSSWSSSSGGGYIRDFKPLSFFEIMLLVSPPFIFWLLIVILSCFKKTEKGKQNISIEKTEIDYPEKYTHYTEENLENAIKKYDEDFSKDKFLSWASELFVKMQETWTTGDWNAIRIYETNELYEQHSQQLKGYTDRNLTNVMEDISVQSIRLADYNQNGDKEVITIVLKSKMRDYIINKTTGNIVKGDKTIFRYGMYKMEFIRKTGVKTSDSINTVQCPNCGAETQITVSGKCEYCGSMLTTGEHNWALSNLERIG